MTPHVNVDLALSEKTISLSSGSWYPVTFRLETAIPQPWTSRISSRPAARCGGRMNIYGTWGKSSPTPNLHGSRTGPRQSNCTNARRRCSGRSSDSASRSLSTLTALGSKAFALSIWLITSQDPGHLTLFCSARLSAVIGTRATTCIAVNHIVTYLSSQHTISS